jgi:hypothetical protein
MKSAVFLVSLLLGVDLLTSQAGYPADSAAYSLRKPISPKSSPSETIDYWADVSENQLLIFVKTWGPFAGEFIQIDPQNLPAGATMPYRSGTGVELSSTFNWIPTFCQGRTEYYLVNINFLREEIPGYPTMDHTDIYHINVHNVNRAPFFESAAMADTISFQGSLHIYPTAHDSDCIQCGDDTLYMSYTADPPSAYIVFSDQGLGVSSFLWTPTSADSGWHTVTFTVTDAHDTSATQVWNILVRVNHAPTITSTIPSQLQLRIGQNYHLNLTAFDYDLQQFGDDTLKMSYSATPSAITANFIDNGGGSATFDWTPIATERGNHSITFKATDRFNIADTKQMLAQVYVCGDANNDGSVDISDAVYLISYIFSGGSAPSPLLAGDANCDHTVDISDVVYLISYIFSGGSAPCTTCK